MWLVFDVGLSRGGSGIACVFVDFCVCRICGCSFALDISILVGALLHIAFCIWGTFVCVFLVGVFFGVV